MDNQELIRLLKEYRQKQIHEEKLYQEFNTVEDITTLEGQYQLAKIDTRACACAIVEILCKEYKI